MSEEKIMEARAIARYVRISPRKVRSAAETVAKVLNSAVANAEHNYGMRADSLVVKATYVDEGPTMKRIRCRAKGSAARINKRTSHITVIVAPKEA